MIGLEGRIGESLRRRDPQGDILNTRQSSS